MVSAVTAGGPSDAGGAGGVQDAPAGTGEEGVEPHRDAFVLVALDLDVVRLARLGEVLRDREHLGHVLGAVGTREHVVPQQLRVAVDRHRAQLALVQIAVARAGERAILGRGLLAPVHGSIQPASANSAAHVTSRPRMSMRFSFAARRRTICWRWPSAAAGSCW